MKKMITILFAVVLFANTVFAETIYIPTEDSDEYLPTVKIFSYTLDYDGSLVSESYGSGTLIDSAGTILTNNHVIENNDAFQICLTKSNDPQEPICRFTASLIERDSDHGVALLRMDSRDVKGISLVFDFSLPYDNSSSYSVGDSLTVIGYPDIGGRTITFTSGLISGLLTDNGVDLIKTDADISFGNSGGTAVDENGNFIGIPTYIVGSSSSEVLGYLFPISEVVTWIVDNKKGDLMRNDAADAALKSAMVANINANETGKYQNDYPPYSISVAQDWKFGNSLEGAFDGGNYGSFYGDDEVVLYPVDRTDETQLYVSVSVSDYAYEVELSDIEFILGEYETFDAESSSERVKLNGRYDAVKETYSFYDTTVTYYLPYGDKVINVSYSYTSDEEERLSEVDEIIESFSVDMTKVKSSMVNEVSSYDPQIKVVNTLDDVFLSDDSYEYDGVNYFGASFGKKRDYNFYINVFSNEYWEDEYVDDFDLFKADTLADANEWYDVVDEGELRIDGHEGFYFTDEYDVLYTSIYVDGDDDTYFTIYYSAEEDSYYENLVDFREVLKNIELSNAGEGLYMVPNFKKNTSFVASGSGGVLNDIDNYIYEDNIRSLESSGAFGDAIIGKFEPANAMTREDFVVWAVRTLQGDLFADFTDFEMIYDGCASDCFTDVDYNSDSAVYIEYAKSVGAVGANPYFSPKYQISLMAALKVIFELYEYDVWAAPDWVSWYVPYLHLGYQNYVIPYGVSEAGYLLNRGEAAYIIDGVMNDFLYYDDYWY